MMSFKVVFTATLPIPVDKGGFSRLGVELVVVPCPTEEAIVAVAHDADAVITSVEPFTRKVIEKLACCRLISTPKVGYENIDVAAATEYGICISNIPDLCADEVSDHAMALILTLARRVVTLNRFVKGGEWKALFSPEIQELWRGMASLRGQTLGLIGLGRVPQALVPKAKGFGMRLLAYDPYVAPSLAEALEVKLVELSRLLSESDYVSIHTPLTLETRHMMGYEEFRKMKPTSHFINTARGSLVDERALYVALTQGQIAGAGLDVVETEPIGMDNPLLKLDNVIITGHSAHYSDEVWVEISRRPVEDVAMILSEKWPKGWVNPEVKEKYLSKWSHKAR